MTESTLDKPSELPTQQSTTATDSRCGDKPTESDDIPDDAVEQPRPDPTRYGDWEKDGRCIDF